MSREWHRWTGLIFVFATFVMCGMWGRQMREAESDRQFWRSLWHYVRNEDELVFSADRFHAGLFGGFFWCGILLLASGVILWFPQSIPWNLRYLRYFAVIIHPICALLSIGLFINHVYMSTAMERGAFGSVIRGDVSVGWAKRYHRVWYEQLARDASLRK